MTTNEHTERAELIVRLVDRYKASEIPTCRVCGAALSVAACGGGEPTKYACSEMTMGSGKTIDWDHYNRSQWEDRRHGGDEDVIELIDLYRAAILAADDKAGGEPVAWMREDWGPDCGPYVEFYRDDEMGWRDRKEWTPLYTRPQPKAEVRVPDGWHFNTADFSMQAQGKSSTGSVMLIRDTKGLRAWCMLSDDDRDRVELHVSGEGTTVLEAIADASSKAIIAAAPKPKD